MNHETITKIRQDEKELGLAPAKLERMSETRFQCYMGLIDKLKDERKGNFDDAVSCIRSEWRNGGI